MPIVIEDLSGISEGIKTAGSALASALERRAENRLKQQEQREKQQQQQQQLGALQQALTGADLQSQAGQQDFLMKTSAAGIPINDSLGVLDRAIKQQRASQQPFQIDDPSELSGLFTRLGVPEDRAADYADLYGNLSQGGRTAFANMFIENLQRGQFSPVQAAALDPGMGDEAPAAALQQQPPVQQAPRSVPDQQAAASEEAFSWPEVNMFEGLTAKEKVQRQKELFNVNAKEFSELSSKIKGIKDDSVRVNQLEKFNESGQLPEGMNKLNINWKTGDIRVPALANAATQAFVKNINDFTIKAKETFGARVTNFELAAFMRRLPTLANSTEGRRQIISQMKAMNDLDQLYYESRKDAYDHYGLRGVDSQKVEKYAAEQRSVKEEQLKQKVLKSTEAQSIHELKLSLPEGHALIEYQGKRGAVPLQEVERAISKGARVL